MKVWQNKLTKKLMMSVSWTDLMGSKYGNYAARCLVMFKF